MTKENRTKKPGRNDRCPCGSGAKYKYCCIFKEPRSHVVTLDQKCGGCGNHLEVDVGKDWASLMSNAELPLKNFCKDNNFYWFSSAITEGQMLEFSSMLREGRLTIKHLTDTYKSKLTKENVLGLLEDAEELHPALTSRIPIVRDAVGAHFEGKYSLSVPALFPQIEGFHREYGGLTLKQNFVPTLPKDVWNARFLPGFTDSIHFFNAYLTKLFEGSQPDDSFNRNPILHGANASYASEDWSLILILIVLEIRLFLWFEKNTHPMLKEAPRDPAKKSRA
jgi:hypothetical protein